MNISHPFVKSEIYKLIRTTEFDVAIGDDSFELRVELFQAASSPNFFRAHIWRKEFFSIQSVFPQDEKTHEPIDSPSGEKIIVDFSYHLRGKYSHFKAESETVAIQLILDDFQMFLNHVSDK